MFRVFERHGLEPLQSIDASLSTHFAVYNKATKNDSEVCGFGLNAIKNVLIK